MTVAELIVEGLLRARVPRVFGVAGGGLTDLIAAAERRRPARRLLSTARQRPCMMAAATGELTGGPGAGRLGLGPGVAASAAGLAHARLDRAPLLLVSDRHPAAVALRHPSGPRPREHLGPLVKGSVTIGPSRPATGWPTPCSSPSPSRAGPCTWTCPRTWRRGRRSRPRGDVGRRPCRRRTPRARRGRRADRAGAAAAGRRGAGVSRPATPSGCARSARRCPRPSSPPEGQGRVPDPHPLALGDRGRGAGASRCCGGRTS